MEKHEEMQSAQVDFGMIVRAVNPPRMQVCIKEVIKEKVVEKVVFKDKPIPKNTFCLEILPGHWEALSIEELNVKLKCFESIGMTLFNVKKN